MLVGSNSKSVGNGISVSSVSGAGAEISVTGEVTSMGWLNAERCSGVIFICARMYAVRNSDGNSGGRVFASVSFLFSAFSSLFSGDAGGFIKVGCICDHNFFIKSGTGMLNSGFFVRIINVVLAMYNGSAASINMPNTKPGNPRNSARIRWFQWVPENISKLNMNFKINHIVAT